MGICYIIGTPALTSRSMVEDDMKKVAAFIHEGIQIAIDVDTRLSATTKSTNKAFKEFLMKDETALKKIEELRLKVEVFAKTFPMPGFDNH